MSGFLAEAEEARLQATAWLIPVAGPPIDPIVIREAPGGQVLGRGDTAGLRMPATAEKVSRAHCRFACVEGEWSVTDSSRWGTFVNGIKLAPGTPVSLRESDTVRIAPWTFRFSLQAPKQQGIDLADDPAAAGGDVRAVDEASARMLASELVDLLTQSTELIHAARSELELAEALIEVALKGTGLSNAAVLKVVDASGRVEPIASRVSAASRGQALFSRSLVARARQGQVSEHRVDAVSGGNAGFGESVMQMKISAAICAPLLIGDGTAPAGERDVAALLYLDARGAASPNVSNNAAGFTMALARIASLALANLRRIEMALRVKESQHELEAAAQAQKLILPVRDARLGEFHYHGESRPGQMVGGDFFDVIQLSPRKLAVALGDVTGKGVSASVLMTTAFGFLHAHMEAGGDVASAAASLSKFLHPRRQSSRFITLWLGVFDLDTRTVTYVDCGHGWACLQHADGTYEGLDKGGGLPCGIQDDWEYQTATAVLRPGSRALIVSDGFVEQQGLVVGADGRPVMDQFGMAGLQNALAKRPSVTVGPTTVSPAAAAGPSSMGGAMSSMSSMSSGQPIDDLKYLYDALISFAGTTQLSDDATAILVRWD